MEKVVVRLKKDQVAEIVQADGRPGMTLVKGQKIELGAGDKAILHLDPSHLTKEAIVSVANSQS